MKRISKENLGMSYGVIKVPQLPHQDKKMLTSISDNKMIVILKIAGKLQRRKLLNADLDKSDYEICSVMGSCRHGEEKHVVACPTSNA